MFALPRALATRPGIAARNGEQKGQRSWPGEPGSPSAAGGLVAALAEPGLHSRLTGYGRERNRLLASRRSARSCGSSGGKRRPDPHGHGSLRPSFSTSSVSVPTTRSPRLTLDSLEGTPGGVCWSAQKDASASRSRYMAILLLKATGEEIVAQIRRVSPTGILRFLDRAGLEPAGLRAHGSSKLAVIAQTSGDPAQPQQVRH